MSNNLTMIQVDNVPAYLAELSRNAAEGNAALGAGATTGFASLSIKGKTWHMIKGGDRTLIRDERTNDPRSSLELVILKAQPATARTYYGGVGYTEGADEKPVCFSNDGIAPSIASEQRQSDKCALCKHSVYGSKVSDSGAKGFACASSQRLAVAGPGDLSTPMLLRVPVMSLKDLKSYGAQLTKRGWPYEALITKVGFDHDVAYPKLTFTAIDFLTKEQLDEARATADTEVINEILGLADSLDADSNGFDALRTAPSHMQVEAKPAAASVARASRGRPAKAVVTEEDIAATEASFTEDKPAPVAPVAAAPVATVPAAAATSAQSAMLAKMDAALNGLFDDD